MGRIIVAKLWDKSLRQAVCGTSHSLIGAARGHVGRGPDPPKQVGNLFSRTAGAEWADNSMRAGRILDEQSELHHARQMEAKLDAAWTGSSRSSEQGSFHDLGSKAEVVTGNQVTLAHGIRGTADTGLP